MTLDQQQVKERLLGLPFDSGKARLPSADVVRELEKHLGFEFPKGFRVLLMEVAGQRCQEATAPVWYGRSWMMNKVETFAEAIGFDDPDFETSVYEILDWGEMTRHALSGKLADGRDRELLPFAGNSSDGVFCLDYQNRSDMPIVVYADYQPGRGQYPLKYVAPTFSDFVMLITTDFSIAEVPDEITSEAEVWIRANDPSATLK